MSARDRILAKVRTAVRETGSEAERRQTAATRIGERPRHLIPERVAGKSADETRAVLMKHFAMHGVTVKEAATAADVPAAVAAYLRETNLPARLRSGFDAYLGAVPWASEPSLTVELGRADPADEVGLSHAVAAVAETGTLVLGSGADNPVTLNFLPENHVVVVEAGDIVGPYEDAWIKVRARFGAGVLPRTLNMISGPSRTGDIGGRIVMGAHGPRRLCVVVVG